MWLRGRRDLNDRARRTGIEMSNIEREATGFSAAMTPAETAAIDAGLRAYMLRVYNYMAIGLAITGAAALILYLLSVTHDLAAASYVVRAGRAIPVPAGLAVQPRDILLTGVGYTVFVSPLKWAVILAPFAVMLALNFNVERIRPAAAQLLFWLYSVLVGLSFASILLIYAHTAVARAFFIAAAAFGALSLWGHVSRRDVGGVGAFAVMGLFGLLVAALVNLVLDSSTLQWTISVVAVVVFSALTAWDTQKLKSEYLYGAMDGEADGDVVERSAVLGALSLYLDFIFISLFTLLLQLTGPRDE